MDKLSCSFCDIKNILGDEEKVRQLPYFDRPIFSTSKLYFIQAKHRVVEGHTLLVTKQHYYSFSEVPNEEIDEILNDFSRVYASMAKLYKNVNVFEHGLASESPASCMEHAHLHFLPVTESVDHILARKFDLVSSHDTLQDAYKRLLPPYILIKELNGKWKNYKIPDSIPGQYVCRLYLDAVGKSDKSWVNIIKNDMSYKKTWELLKGYINEEK